MTRPKALFIGILVIGFVVPIGAAAIYWQADPGHVLNAIAKVQQFTRDHFLLALMFYGLWSFILQLTVFPGGTVTIFIACFLIGPLAAILVYLLAMLVAIWPVYWVIDKLTQARSSAIAERIFARVHPALSELPAEVRREGVLASIILRLTPFFPSGIATAAAALLGIPIRHYVLGTLLSAWTRPVLIATSALGLETIADALYRSSGERTIQTLTLSALAGVAILGISIRIWVRRRARKLASKDA